MELVMYHPERDKIQIWTKYPNIFWRGEPWLVWTDLETALELGWQVIGTL